MTSGATRAATTGAASVQRLHDGLDTGTVLSSAWLSAPARDVWPLCDHALRAPTSRQPYAPGDPGPGLVLVRDDGVYLMSNGLPVQARPDGAGAVTVHLSTPRGRVLRTWSESMTALRGGGDDTAVLLPLDPPVARALARAGAGDRLWVRYDRGLVSTAVGPVAPRRAAGPPGPRAGARDGAGAAAAPATGATVRP